MTTIVYLFLRSGHACNVRQRLTPVQAYNRLWDVTDDSDE